MDKPISLKNISLKNIMDLKLLSPKEGDILLVEVDDATVVTPEFAKRIRDDIFSATGVRIFVVVLEMGGYISLVSKAELLNRLDLPTSP